MEISITKYDLFKFEIEEQLGVQFDVLKFQLMSLFIVYNSLFVCLFVHSLKSKPKHKLF